MPDSILVVIDTFAAFSIEKKLLPVQLCLFPCLSEVWESMEKQQPSGGWLAGTMMESTQQSKLSQTRLQADKAQGRGAESPHCQALPSKLYFNIA